MIASVLTAAGISWSVVGVVCRFADRLGLVDRPGVRKVHTRPVPLGGGLGIWAGVVGTLGMGTLLVVLLPAIPAVWERLPGSIHAYMGGMRDKIPEVWGLVLGGTALMLVGLADDRRGLPWWVRLGIEFAVAAGCVYWQGLHLTAFIDLPWLTSLLSVVWIVALINSFNMLDNMDALSGGVAVICAAMLAGMLLMEPDGGASQPQLFVAAMLLILVGAVLGFLKHNWPPAKIFMGDAGSYFIGFWIAVATLLATYTGYRGEHPHAVVAPLVVLAIPLYDMVSVILIRLSEGRSPFEADKRHFSHRLVDLGMTKEQAVMTVCLATAACSLGAWMLPRTDWIGAGFVVAQTVLVLCVIRVLESVRRGQGGGDEQP
ncbi:MAG: undecaprenyl/decaprenyl-phosphate alpha-N-acetylglucosaminyl 1-phosphate transferase [Planctomycetota bacterium]|nr:MAG: undecaprenyl/decaprenyl-phosphate alpha-N-acetylglucosaminyl 1-phosphate transferase [Planctomycetota bacterium]